MDPVSLSMLVGLITKSAAGEAGKSAWQTLVGMVRHAFGSREQTEIALRKASDADPDGALELAGYLVQAAAADPELGRMLRTWISEAESATHTGTVINAIGGSARIHGNVVQARDIDTVHLGCDHGD